MGYPVSSAVPSSGAAKRTVDQRVGAVGLVAGAMYVIGYYLPLFESGGTSGSFSDGDTAAMWAWVVPGLIAAIAGGLALAGKRLAGPVAAGAALGLAGFTAFELLVIDELTSTTDDFGVYSVEISKGIGFWVLALAAVLGAVAGVMAVLGRGSRRETPVQAAAAPAIIGALCLVGVPLSLLLPEHGSSPLSDMPTGALKAGLLAWALLAPVLGFAMVMSRTVSGIAGGAGVALAHCGYSLTMAFGDASSAVTSSAHSGLYHGTAWASLVLLAIAIAQAVKTPPGSATGTPHGAPAAAGQWAADPYGRHQYRWYDGVRWTAQVSDSGVVGHDEPVSGPPPIPRDQWQPPHQ